MEYPLFQETIKIISNRGYYYSIREIKNFERRFDLGTYLYLFTIADEKAFVQTVKALTKKQIEEILFGISKIVENFGTEKLIIIFRLRYRRYIFRIMYLLWQEYYDNKNYHALFHYLFTDPKTSAYVDEVHFTTGILHELTMSPHPDESLSVLARNENLDMREFLAAHKINRESVIGIDAMSIFFLFCPAQDYLEFGSERLIVALKRFDLKNQAKILNNMVHVLTEEDRAELSDVFLYFINTYTNNKTGQVHEFWDNVFLKVRRIIQEDFNAPLL